MSNFRERIAAIKQTEEERQRRIRTQQLEQTAKEKANQEALVNERLQLAREVIERIGVHAVLSEMQSEWGEGMIGSEEIGQLVIVSLSAEYPVYHRRRRATGEKWVNGPYSYAKEVGGKSGYIQKSGYGRHKEWIYEDYEEQEIRTTDFAVLTQATNTVADICIYDSDGFLHSSHYYGTLLYEDPETKKRVDSYSSPPIQNREPLPEPYSSWSITAPLIGKSAASKDVEAILKPFLRAAALTSVDHRIQDQRLPSDLRARHIVI